LASHAPNIRDNRQFLSLLLSPIHANPVQLADRLLRRFGSIAAIVDAPAAALRDCAGHGERWVDSLLVMRDLIRAGARERVLRSKLVPDDPAMHRYLLNAMRGLREERQIAFLADAAGYVICEEIVAEGTESSLALSPRRIFARALAVDCRRIVLAHNHPSGSAEPSKSDIYNTRLLVRQAAGLGISIDDHLVVGRFDVTSMRARGLL
jgi:DNA repair protein RadC